jgi:hypothetical protein
VTPFADAAGFQISGDAALGAQALPYVGDDADVTRLDPVATETVRVLPAAAALRLDGPDGFYGALRVEEGVVHAGGLEAAEARVGWRHAWTDGSLGRDDVPLTRDRELEAEDLVFSVRPVLSRDLLPLHATGARAVATWPGERGSLAVGASWPALTSDAPWTWARLTVSPLGPLPEEQDARPGSPRIQLGGAIARMDSPTLGESVLLAGDLSVAWGRVFGDAGWIHAVDGPEEWLAEAGVAIGPSQGPDVHVAARGERATGLEEGEDARWLASARVALRLHDRRVELYAEGLHSIEQGSATRPGEDVVVLNDSIERSNDLLAFGVLLRL